MAEQGSFEDQGNQLSPADWPELPPGRMSPRERVRTALSHQEPDRVPADLWAVPEVWQRLQHYFGDVSQAEVLKRLQVDVRWVVPDYVGPERTLPNGVRVDRFGAWRQEVQHEFGTYSEYAGFPLADAQTASDVHAWDWSRTEYWDMDSIKLQLAQFDAEDEYFVCYDVGGIFERSWGLLGLERFLMDLVTNPEVPCAIMDCMTDLYIANVTRLLEAGAGRVDMVYTWDDVAHQQGLFISPAMWRKYILPRHQRLNAAIRAFNVKLMFHSCGAIYPLIPDLIHDMSIDVLNPLQPRAKGMDLSRIKDEFGQQLTFHGGVDLQYTLPHGSPDEVRAEVRERCSVLGRGGGYILSAAHYIQNDVPTENILAMYKTPREV
jgi:uroporphyrinogen decarboxylase